MADGDDVQSPQSDGPKEAEIRMELRDSLPGDRAFVGVEQDGEFVWLASRKYVEPKAVAEFIDIARTLVRSGGWPRNWPAH